MSDRTYRVRYSVEPWDNPPQGQGRLVEDGSVRVMDDKYGYSDEILVVSFLTKLTGEYDSIALFDSESGCGRPSRKMLEAAKAQIEHQLEHHCDR